MAANPYKATVHYAGDEFFIGIPPSGNAQTIDAKGDRKAAPSPLELLLVSVAACTAADVISILLKKRQDVRDYNVEVTGERALRWLVMVTNGPASATAQHRLTFGGERYEWTGNYSVQGIR